MCSPFLNVDLAWLVEGGFLGWEEGPSETILDGWLAEQKEQNGKMGSEKRRERRKTRAKTLKCSKCLPYGNVKMF